MSLVRILVGDAIERLRDLPDESVEVGVQRPDGQPKNSGVREARDLGVDSPDGILIELNPEYAELARARVAEDLPLLTTVEVDGPKPDPAEAS